ncbi:hypothetical protein Tco_0536301 [Tanacetum coccineum]
MTSTGIARRIFLTTTFNIKKLFYSTSPSSSSRFPKPNDAFTQNIPNTTVTSISHAAKQPWMKHCYSHIKEHRNQSMTSRTMLKRLFYDAMYLNYEKGEYDGKAIPIESISGNQDLKDNSYSMRDWHDIGCYSMMSLCFKLGVDPDQTMYRAFVDGFIHGSD